MRRRTTSHVVGDVCIRRPIIWPPPPPPPPLAEPAAGEKEKVYIWNEGGTEREGWAEEWWRGRKEMKSEEEGGREREREGREGEGGRRGMDGWMDGWMDGLKEGGRD